MKRFLLRSVAALCLLLCVAAVLAWVGSYTFAMSRFTIIDPTRELLSYRGQILFYHWHTAFYTGWPGVPWWYGGFYYYNQLFLCVSVPHWSIAAAFATLGGLILRSQRHAKRRAGYCTTCGYDLRASTDRCPSAARLRSRPPQRSPNGVAAIGNVANLPGRNTRGSRGMKRHRTGACGRARSQ